MIQAKRIGPQKKHKHWREQLIDDESIIRWNVWRVMRRNICARRVGYLQVCQKKSQNEWRFIYTRSDNLNRS
jgi:hypothetical protein